MKTQVQEELQKSNVSPLRAYARLAVGQTSLLALVRYELLTALFGSWPGALGYWLRRKTYRWFLGSMGSHVIIGRNVTLRGVDRIHLGSNVALDDYTVLDARGDDAMLEIGDGTLLSRNTIVRSRNGVIRIGSGSDIGANCLLATDQKLEIGKHVLIAAYTYCCAGGNHAYDRKDVPIIKQGFINKGGVVIEDDVWIGAHGMILDGVTIGHGSIIGAHSMVNRSIPPHSIAWGQPAERRRDRFADGSGQGGATNGDA